MDIAIAGAAGRMGRLLVREVLATRGVRLAGGLVRKGSAWVGRDVAEATGLAPTGVAAEDDAEAVFRRARVVIDVSVPAAAPDHARLAARLGVALVLGTTGIDEDGQCAVVAASRRTAIVQAPNMSLGMTVVLGAVERAARALGPDFDVEVAGRQHRAKVDAPSGSSRALARAAARGRGLGDDAMRVRAAGGRIGARIAGTIGIATVAGGQLWVEHGVTLAGRGERIELSHKGASRDVYVQGAIKAALWLEGRRPGLYDMADVLGLA